MNQPPKIKRGEAVITLTFTAGNGGVGGLRTLLKNMSRRSFVTAPIVCEVDGVRQEWLDDQEAERMQRAETEETRAAAASAERDRRTAAIEAELDRNPNRSDAEIMAAINLNADIEDVRARRAIRAVVMKRRGNLRLINTGAR